MTASGWGRKRTDTAAERARKAEYNSAEHREIRKQRVAVHTPASLCTCPGRGRSGCSRHVGLCGQPLGHKTSDWHLPHDKTRTGYLPGLWCAGCNRSEAASRGARIVNARRHARRVRRIQGVTQVRL